MFGNDNLLHLMVQGGFIFWKIIMHISATKALLEKLWKA